jgi:hypothetical protein
VSAATAAERAGCNPSFATANGDVQAAFTAAKSGCSWKISIEELHAAPAPAVDFDVPGGLFSVGIDDRFL